MLAIGLTGGIGSGKSTVAEHFRQHGVPVFDADVICRDLVEPGEPALAEIVARFGAGIIDQDGRLDRESLREDVFSDEHKRLALEAILHPRVHAQMRTGLQTLDAPYALLMIPLLVEGGRNDLVQRILVVDLPESEQIARVSHRDGLSEDQVRAIMAAQASREQRLAVADDVIDNRGDPGDLAGQVNALHQRYLQLAGC